MKPKLVIKTVKGKRYLQLKTMNTGLIHLGSADDVKNWVIGINGLEQAYAGLALRDALNLDHDMAIEAFKKYENDARLMPDLWSEFCKKRITTYVNQEFFRKILNGASMDQTLEELVEFHTNLQCASKVANEMLVSFDYYWIATREIIRETDKEAGSVE